MNTSLSEFFFQSKCLILDTGVLAHEHDTCYESGDHFV